MYYLLHNTHSCSRGTPESVSSLSQILLIPCHNLPDLHTISNIKWNAANTNIKSKRHLYVLLMLERIPKQYGDFWCIDRTTPKGSR